MSIDFIFRLIGMVLLFIIGVYYGARFGELAIVGRAHWSGSDAPCDDTPRASDQQNVKPCFRPNTGRRVVWTHGRVSHLRLAGFPFIAAA